jgi:CelD/BcsL family acetyltransferase involved in cellulose biosynthesis
MPPSSVTGGASSRPTTGHDTWKVELIDPVRDPRWAEFVEIAPAASVFHHPRWIGLLEEQYGYEVLACCAVDRDGRVRAGQALAMVKSRLTAARLVGLPFSDICPPLITEGDGAAAALTFALDELRSRLGVSLEVHGSLPQPLPSAHPSKHYLHHVLTLEPDADAVTRRFVKSQILRGARRAQREGLRVELRTDHDALMAFYRLHVATRRRQGLLPHPRRFIARSSRLLDDGLGFVAIALDGAAPAAAAVFLHFRDVLTYKYGASDASRLTKRPNNLLFVEAIRWGCAHGMTTLDFGRTDIGHESLRAFKLAFGADERRLVYTTLSSSGSRRARDWRRASGLAAPLIRHTPPLVSRGLAELLVGRFAA